MKVVNLFTGDVSGEDKKREQNQHANKLRFPLRGKAIRFENPFDSTSSETD